MTFFSAELILLLIPLLLILLLLRDYDFHQLATSVTGVGATKMRSKTPYLSGSLLLLAIGMFATTPTLFAATAQATVSVKVVRNISITSASDMSFGYISTSTAAGSVILEHSGNRQATGGAALEAGGSPSPAKFIASGEPNTSFSISLPAAMVMTDNNGNEMVVSDFSGTSGDLATFNDAGRHELDVGATLHINPNQALGQYAGTIHISVNYD